MLIKCDRESVNKGANLTSGFKYKMLLRLALKHLWTQMKWPNVPETIFCFKTDASLYCLCVNICYMTALQQRKVYTLQIYVWFLSLLANISKWKSISIFSNATACVVKQAWPVLCSTVWTKHQIRFDQRNIYFVFGCFCVNIYHVLCHIYQIQISQSHHSIYRWLSARLQ